MRNNTSFEISKMPVLVISRQDATYSNFESVSVSGVFFSSFASIVSNVEKCPQGNGTKLNLVQHYVSETRNDY